MSKERAREIADNPGTSIVSDVRRALLWALDELSARDGEISLLRKRGKRDALDYMAVCERADAAETLLTAIRALCDAAGLDHSDLILRCFLDGTS